MKNIRYICAQPATTYYIWQVEVLINNFIEMGVNPNYIDIVCGIDNDIPLEWTKMAQHYNTVRFFFYKDTRNTKYYVSSLRPNILKQHFQTRTEILEDIIFYHDCDIIFTKPPCLWITTEMLIDDNCYGSDTRWYISHSYIKSKGLDILNKMCEIVDISPDIVENNELNSIGAQYLLKNIDHIFWENIEINSELLFKQITDINREKVLLEPTYHTLQIWCADMWALLWELWKRGNTTKCHENFNFSWGTSPEETYNELNIMHNAGVVSSSDGLFYKSQFINELPYGKNLQIREGTASKKYWEWIERVKEKSFLYNNKTKPITGRNNSFTKILQILEETYKRPINIVETGCIRNISDESKFGDGWSTLNWEYYAKKTGSKVFVVDINEYHLIQSKKIVPPSEFVEYTHDDSINYLNNFNDRIDLLFLDSFDYCGDEANILACHNHSLGEVKAAWNKLNDKCFILIDDVFNNEWVGKGKLSIPYLLDNGFKIEYFIDSQILLYR